MADSILDRVLSSKEDQEKQLFHPLEILTTLLKTLSSKEADVLRRRYGLTEQGKETLETIGSLYHVTRERIRQIESQSIAKMKASPAFAEVIKPVEHLVISLLNQHGGVMTREMMFDVLLAANDDTSQNRQSIAFILNELLNDKLTPIPKSKKYLPGWKLVLASMEFVDQSIAALEAVIREIGTPKIFDELFEAFVQKPFYIANQQKLTEDAVLAYIDISAKISKNPFDEYGLTEWGLILPKRMNDRVYLVLKKEGKPMHFEEIARRITKIFKKQAYPPTVHNELILNPEYVLVGRGIYALREWGFTDGVVSNVIVAILKKAGTPLQRSEIVERVLQQRIVKKNTIHLALTDKHIFRKTNDGKYTLAEPPVPTAISGA
ncbi:MAG: hypothetical protein HYV32_05275 [Candidatus Kerfeldbacteria bacterium]|nr:hypothetical protein [Candidatus Kerfeldbacteria bacterium]